MTHIRGAQPNPNNTKEQALGCYCYAKLWAIESPQGRGLHQGEMRVQSVSTYRAGQDSTVMRSLTPADQ